MSGLTEKIPSQTLETVAVRQTMALTQKTNITLGRVRCDKRDTEAVMEMLMQPIWQQAM
jgi:hypothetical protein